MTLSLMSCRTFLRLEITERDGEEDEAASVGPARELAEESSSALGP